MEWDKAAPAWGPASSKVNLCGNNLPDLHCCQYLLGGDCATEQTLTAKVCDEKEEWLKGNILPGMVMLFSVFSLYMASSSKDSGHKHAGVIYMQNKLFVSPPTPCSLDSMAVILPLGVCPYHEGKDFDL